MIQSTKLGWRKSSYSGDNGACVEAAAALHRVVAVRDSTDPAGPALAFTGCAWSRFLRGIRS